MQSETACSMMMGGQVLDDCATLAMEGVETGASLHLALGRVPGAVTRVVLVPPDGEPMEVTALRNAGICSMAAGGQKLFATAHDGVLYDIASTPQGPRVRTVTLPQVGVATVSAGSRHVLVAMRDGTVWGWGCNEANQLGTSSHGTSCADPVQVLQLQPHCILAVAAGEQHSLAMNQHGVVFSWGANLEGQCGCGSPGWLGSPSSYGVAPLEALEPCVEIAAGRYHSLALAASGHLYTWGLGSEGQLMGAGGNLPAKVMSPTTAAMPKPIAKIAGGDYHSAAITVDGELFVGGRGFSQAGRLLAQVSCAPPCGRESCSEPDVWTVAVGSAVRPLCVATSASGSRPWQGNGVAQGTAWGIWDMQGHGVVTTH